jgi:hypothetical protein
MERVKLVKATAIQIQQTHSTLASQMTAPVTDIFYWQKENVQNVLTTLTQIQITQYV